VIIEFLGSKVRAAVLICLVKASRFSLPVNPRSIARVYGVNLSETYRFLRRLVDFGFALKNDHGYVLSSRGLKIFEPILGLLPNPDPWRSRELEFIRRFLPDTMYYVSQPMLQSWFGLTPTLLVVDKRLRGRINLPSGFINLGSRRRPGSGNRVFVVYSSLRGREYKYSWDSYLTHATIEQSYADLISYMPTWEDFLPDVLLKSSLFDMDKLLEKTTLEGRRRIATAIAYYSTLSGWRPLLKMNLYSLVSEDLVDRLVAITPYLVDSSIIESRRI